MVNVSDKTATIESQQSVRTDGDVFQVVDARNLEFLTTVGWVLEAVLPEHGVVDTQQKRTPVQGGNYGYDYSTENIYGATHKFLIRKGGESVREGMQNSINALQGEALTAKESLRKANEQIEKLKKDLETENRRRMDAEAREENLRANGRDQIDKLRKYEHDLGKVRRHVGEKMFSEALASADK